MTADIEQWDRQALERLIERGSMTLAEITGAVEADQFELLIAQAWVESALERGFIAETGGSSALTRPRSPPLVGGSRRRRTAKWIGVSRYLPGCSPTGSTTTGSVPDMPPRLLRPRAARGDFRNAQRQPR